MIYIASNLTEVLPRPARQRASVQSCHIVEMRPIPARGALPPPLNLIELDTARDSGLSVGKAQVKEAKRIWLYNARVLKEAGRKVDPVERTAKVGIGAWITQRYTRQGLWSLFLMCAFPLHAWTLILAFRDISWLTDRTNAWDAVGVTAYGLVFAFVESLMLFAVMVLLGYVISGRWEPERRVALLALLALLASFWAMVGQLYFLIGSGVPGWLIDVLIRSGHPLRALQAGTLLLVAATVLVPVLLLLRSERAFRLMRGVIDRLSVLTMFYLVLDVIGLAIVIVRNV